MASLLRRMSSRKEKISEPEAPPTPAADEDDGRVNVRAYNKKVGCPLPPNPHTKPPRFAPPPRPPQSIYGSGFGASRLPFARPLRSL